MEQHFPFLFWAYNIIWILMAGYILGLGVRMRKIQRRIDQLRPPREASGGPESPRRS